MADGVKTGDLTSSSAFDEAVVTVTTDGQKRTRRISRTDLTAQLVATSPLAEALAVGVAGIRWLPSSIGVVRVRATGNVNIANALENGDTLNGVTLATGDIVFLPGQTAGAAGSPVILGDGSSITNSPDNGPYVVPASGAASRATFADSPAELALLGFVIQEGTLGKGEQWNLPLTESQIVSVGTTPLGWSLSDIPSEGFAGIDTRLDDVESEIDTASGAYATLDERLDAADADVGGVKLEIIAGRGGQASLDARADAAEAATAAVTAEVVAGRGGQGSLDARADLAEAATAAVQAEVIAGRGGEGSLDARFDLDEAAIVAAAAEILAGRGGFGSLDARADAAEGATAAVVAEVNALRTPVEGAAFSTANERVSSMETKLNVQMTYFLAGIGLPGNVFTIFDSAWRAAWRIANDGSQHGTDAYFTGEVRDAGGGTLQVIEGGEDAFVVRDPGYRYAARIAEDGSQQLPTLDAQEVLVNGIPVTAEAGSGYFDFRIWHSLWFGQSLPQGADALPLPDKGEIVPEAYMFVGGVRIETPMSSTGQFDSFADLTESDVSTNENQTVKNGETPASGFAMASKQLYWERNGVLLTEIKSSPLVTVGGLGGLTMAQLNSGGYLTRLLNSIDSGYDVADDMGEQFGATDLNIWHGEQDAVAGTATATYQAGLVDWLDQVDAKAKTGGRQTFDVRMFIAQSHRGANSNIQKAIIQAARANPTRIYATAPQYFLQKAADNTHLDAILGVRWLTAFHAIMRWRVITMRQANSAPLWITAGARDGRWVTLTYNVPVKPLVFDTSWVSAAANYGYLLFDADGTTPISIDDGTVHVVEGNKVRFRAASTVPLDAVVTYATLNGDTSLTNRFTGQRGNLRDSQGKFFTMNAGRGFRLRCDNYAMQEPGWVLDV